jgi:CRP/FNR family transcriptional regulator, cyclic AMP receptor protein
MQANQAQPTETDITKKVAGFFDVYPARHYAKKHTLALADTEPDGVWYLESGEVRQYDITPSGDHIVLNVFKPRAFFPMSWAINKTPNQYFFDTLTDVVIRTAPAEEVVQFVQSNPDVLFDLLARVYRGTDGLLGRMARLMQNSGRNRILFELVLACQRTKQIEGPYALHIHETDLASRVGLARETVNREMRNLKAQGLIEVTSDGIVIPDLTKLKAATEL